MTKMSTVEKIVRSFKRDYDICKEPEWFQRWTERSSILLGEVTAEEAVTLYNKYGISSENEDDRITYRIDNLQRFEDAVA